MSKSFMDSPDVEKRDYKDGQINSKRVAAILPAAFGLVACYGLGFGLLSLPTALFVGPHLLVAAAANIIVGAASVIVAVGLRRRAQWAWLSGVILSSFVALILLWTFAASLLARELANSVFFGLFSLVFLGLLIAMFTSRRVYYDRL